MFCTNCGTENSDTDNFCKNCGQPLGSGNEKQAGTAGDTQGAPGPTPQQYSSFQTEPLEDTGKSSGVSVAALILGIVSIVFCCLHIVAIACGIVAIVLAKKEEQKGMANGFTKAGFICGLIGAILGGIFLIYWIIAVALHGSVTFRSHRHY